MQLAPTLWSLGAAIPAVLCEYLYRRLPGSWWEYVWIWTPLALTISYCICQLIRQPGTNIVEALIIWTMSVMVLRIFITVGLLGDYVAPGTWFALALIVLARIAQAFWK